MRMPISKTALILLNFKYLQRFAASDRRAPVSQECKPPL
jgi:hypothetical protein